MISGESSFMNTHQLQHQMKIDEDTEIIATHHRLYLFFIWFTALSHLSNNENTTTSQIENFTITLL